MFSALENPDKFRNRHIGPGASEVADMLTVVKTDTLDELIAQTVPAHIRLPRPLPLAAGFSEQQTIARLRSFAAKNKTYRTYIGMGYANCLIPGVIQRNVLENPGWYTQYTPYQAEIAQGRLEALLNFQTMICDLTGMEIANASLLDEGTAAAEAMAMLHALSRGKNKSDVFLVGQDVHPQTIGVLQTRAEPLGIRLAYMDAGSETPPEGEFFGVLIQYPATDGAIYDYRAFVAAAKARNIAVVFAADLLSLALLVSPGELGADIAVGCAQRFGVPLGYGGPHAAFFATRDEFKRLLPGRIVGVSIDAQGKPALRLALQTREQHIRREKATSNICTAQVLLAVMASMYAVYHGPEGIKAIAKKTHAAARTLAEALHELGFSQVYSHYFDTLRIDLGDNAHLKMESLVKRAKESGINFRIYDEDASVGIALDETVTIQDLKEILEVFRTVSETPNKDIYIEKYAEGKEKLGLSAQFVRQTPYLTHPVFNRYHSETELLRYLKKLENRDLSLTSSMIPLGSCTMKLNATTEMVPLSWPEFSNLHPFAPIAQTEGYREMFRELEDMLCKITGFAAFSLQPNSGAQGEYAGLMAIRKYHLAKGDGRRNVALIPSSAHGTNPASAVMAGMKVVVVKCDENGNIDVADMRAQAEKYAENLAALMVTYPSTHGVFEESIQEICHIVHERGGLVYMDGANMNAQLGLTNPATIGADVCHLNLHKTFCIPHGGGGPGMGPIGVVEKLAPYLPSHPVIPIHGTEAMTPVSAAPWGSASILLISYTYILMMGGEGLTDATKIAILNANYIKARLEKHYPVLYQGKNGRVAHELILDMRSFKHSADVEVEDIAKRLIDYGFHAPTISFPVPGTMMIEPTESENKRELDRFCDAMLAIRAEIQEIIDGSASKNDNVLKNAPHTVETVTADEWKHSYSRAKAAFPVAWVRDAKFWPFVGRVNNVHGDRNLICSCPPIEAYADEPFAAHLEEKPIIVG